MLRGLLNVVWSDLGRMTPVELDFARTALLTLLAAAVGPEEPVDQAAIMPLLRKQMDSWIDAHLSFGPLTVGDLATAHHVSEPTVQRVYARNGDTVSGVIRRRRIQRARAKLISTDHLIAFVAAHAW
jgi:AraC-like DNA-binding protein